MRVLAAALVLLAPLAAHAQATAADSDLVEAVVETTDWGLIEATFLSGLASQAGPGNATGFEDVFDAEAVRDSARAALLAEPDPARLGAILAYLRSPANAAIEARTLANAEQMQTPDGMRRFMEQLQDPEPKKGTRADEALARRLVLAQGFADRALITARRTFEALSERSPEFRAELDRAPGGIDALVPEPDPATRERMEQMQVRGAQIGYAGVSEAALREAAAFAESPAGQFYNDVLFEATLNVVVPRMADRMAEAFAGFQPPPAPPPPPPEPEAIEIFEVAEVQPELIGGLAGLQSRVVYPEAARRADIEGQVVVQFVVDPNGRVIDPVVLRSPNDLLSEAALAAVRDSKFMPGMQRDRPVFVRFAVPITFQLNDPTLDEIAGDVEQYLNGPLYPPTSEEPEAFELPDTPPELIGGFAGLSERLVYPEAAERDGIEGVVVVRLVIAEDGTVEDATVKESPDERLNEAALEAVRASRFTPGSRDGRPIRSPIAVPVLFRLAGR